MIYTIPGVQEIPQSLRTTKPRAAGSANEEGVDGSGGFSQPLRSFTSYLF